MGEERDKEVWRRKDQQKMKVKKESKNGIYREVRTTSNLRASHIARGIFDF